MVENVERHIREGKTPLEAAHRRRARAGRPDHRDDDHAGRGLRADRLPGRPDRRALPRVRLHARGRGVHLRRRRAHAVADDVVAAAPRRTRAGRGCRALDRPRASSALRDALRRALLGGTLRTGRPSTRCGSCSRSLVVPMYMFSPKELAPNEDQGVVFGAIDVPANATLEQLTPYTEQVEPHLRDRRPSSITASRSRFPTGGFGGMLVKPWEERKRSIFPIQDELAGKLAKITGDPRAGVPAVGAAERRLLPGRVRDRVDGRARRDPPLRPAARRRRPSKSGQFAFPPIIDVRIDQAEDARSSLDRDKVASMGLTMQQVGARSRRRCSAATSSTASTSTAAATRSSRRSSAPAGSPPTSSRTSTSAGPNGQLIPLSAVATLRDGVEPRTLNRFQQLNAVKISGVAHALARRRPQGARRGGGEDPAAGLPRRLHRRVAPAPAGGRQVPAGDGPRARPDLPGARRAVQLVPRSVRHPRRARCRSRCSAR